MKKVLLAALLIGAPSLAVADEIRWERNVALGVGESMVIAPARANCDDREIPRWSRVERKLPQSKLGAFSDGGEGETDSRRCGGMVPARAIVFTAEKTGQESLEIYGETISIIVR